MRIGQGFDVHQLVEGRPLIIGGVTIPHDKGALGHSDADVLLHAICDALLGAANLGDIGQLFPSSDPSLKNIDSTVLLEQVVRLIEEHRWAFEYMDCTIVLQAPKLAPYLDAMKSRIAKIIGVTEDLISIKATTTDHLGSIGREEGIAAFCTLLLRPVSN